MIRECKHHGITDFAKRPDSGYRCKKCRSQSVTRTRKNILNRIVEEAGGKCEKCGYNKYKAVLEFHHRDPSTKLFEINMAKISSYKKSKTEANKCMLLCANCHREIHEEMKLECC